MPSFTSSSSSAPGGAGTAVAPAPVPAPAPLPEERPLPAKRLGVAAITAMLVFLTALGAWEMYWRSYGSVPSYRNTEGLWARERRRISNGEGNASVLIGSSRTLSNVQLGVWERLEGKRPIQLALEGTSPLRVLEGLADDPNFTGKLYIGVTPVLFYTGFEKRTDVLDYYPKETPSERASQRLSMWLLDPYFAYYDPDFALFTILQRQPWPQRAGVKSEREVRKLFVSGSDRSMHLWHKVETDPAYQENAKDIWKRLLLGPPDPKVVAGLMAGRIKQIDRAVAAVEKLRKRGVEVTFIMHPHDGEFREFERRFAPRAETWDILMARAGALGAHGIYYEDYPELQGYRLPEWSHMATADAERYTEALYRVIHRGDGPAATAQKH